MQLPLKLRLTLVFGVGMALVLIGLGTFGYFRVQDYLLESVDAGLRSRAQLVVSSGGGINQTRSNQGEGKLIDPDEAFSQVLDASGKILETTSAVSNAPLLTSKEIEAHSEPFFVTRQMEDIGAYEGLDDPFRLFAVPLDGHSSRVVVVGATLSDVNEALQRLLEVMVTIGPVAILFTAGAGWLLAGATLYPVEQMRREAAAVSASEPARRLPVPRTGDELARLATTLNAMLDRLQGAIERERRFVDNASHELRTPLATLRGEIELALARRRKAPELLESLRRAQEDVLRLQRLAEDMLVLARYRGGRMPVRRLPIRLSALIARTLESLETQVRESSVKIEIDAPDEEVEVDPDRMHQALRNLLENAMRHTPEGGVVRVSADRARGMLRLIVEDSGPGFPQEQIGGVFDPFTHGSSEATSSVSTGLGLAIVRAVAEAHGGSTLAENTPNGARVTLEVRI